MSVTEYNGFKTAINFCSVPCFCFANSTCILHYTLFHTQSSIYNHWYGTFYTKVFGQGNQNCFFLTGSSIVASSSLSSFYSTFIYKWCSQLGSSPTLEDVNSASSCIPKWSNVTSPNNHPITSFLFSGFCQSVSVIII